MLRVSFLQPLECEVFLPELCEYLCHLEGRKAFLFRFFDLPGLADSYSLLSDYESVPAEETYRQAKMAAVKALQIDGELAEARTSLAYIKAFYEWDWAGAEMEFMRAILFNEVR